MSGILGARSRPVARSSRRTGFAFARSARSAADRTMRRRDTMLSRPSADARHWLERRTSMRDHAVENGIQTDRWGIADEIPNLREIRHAARHVFESCLVRLIVRDMNDVGA